MKIAIISDSHDNLPNIYKALDFIKKAGISVILHCGDVCAPGALQEFAKNFEGEIHLVYGNVDGDKEGFERVSQEFKNVKIHGKGGSEAEALLPPKTGELNLEGKSIAFTHFPASARELGQTGKYRIVFYGHTHKPCLARRSLGEGGGREKSECLLVNPGTLAGMFYKATFAVYDTVSDKLELKIIEKLG